MFTGLVESTGAIRKRTLQGEAGKLQVQSHKIFDKLESGESIAVNGACLTLEKFDGDMLEFHVMQETFSRTNLGALPIGAVVNMERALAVGDRFGGHMVSGHVDATAKILSLEKVGSDTEVKLELPGLIAAYLVPKGSICIDGISLTIASLAERFFTVRIIPTTWNETNLRYAKAGAVVNLEADMLGKYVRFQLEAILKEGKSSPGKEIDMTDLMNAGFLE